MSKVMNRDVEMKSASMQLKWFEDTLELSYLSLSQQLIATVSG